ncbi:transcription initiation factor TFIID subunit 4-like [Lontra canadensis]|uniref:transcription initiation factor TFIID subunit 4-like n=1 Tax=Lontra canadensis TaxID=76717 RepID=UPI0013F39B0F|nr:transcription initiation factor TFIID subunit 4-like [Lontra canadensis]
MSLDPTLPEVRAGAASPTFGSLRDELRERAPRGGRVAPWPGPGQSPVMLHRPPRSTARRPRAGGPERPADAAGAQDTALLPRFRAWPRPTARGLGLAGGHAVVASWMAWDPRLQTSGDAGPSLAGGAG